jgi:peptidoglycan/LPS O-acetylase OafA/YrhL
VVYGTLWLSCQPWLRRLRLPGDFSYGVYVYGWPVQQAVYHLWPHAGIHANQVISTAAALLLGIASWYSVERPCISFGRALIRRAEAARDWGGSLLAANTRTRVREPEVRPAEVRSVRE